MTYYDSCRTLSYILNIVKSEQNLFSENLGISVRKPFVKWVPDAQLAIEVDIGSYAAQYIDITLA